MVEICKRPQISVVIWHTVAGKVGRRGVEQQLWNKEVIPESSLTAFLLKKIVYVKSNGKSYEMVIAMSSCCSYKDTYIAVVSDLSFVFLKPQTNSVYQ